MAILVFVLAFIGYKMKKEAAAKKADSKDIGNQILATVSTTTVVDPVTGDELVVSPQGVNALDQGAGSAQLKSNINDVINLVQDRDGITPSELTLKVYDASNRYVGSTKITNPLVSGKTALGYTAPQAVVNGTINYQCNNTDQLRGPGYYTTETGQDLFGMFCN